MIRWRLLWFFLVVCGFFGAPPASAAPATMTIATGPVSGFALPLGGALCRLLEHDAQQKSRCAILATDGSVDDIDRLRNGDANLAIVQADVAADALNATGAFHGKPPFTDLRSLAGFYAQALTVLVRGDGPVAQVDDLKGKRIAVGEPGLPDPLFTDFLDALGWAKSDLGGAVEMPRREQIAALCSGGIAAIALTAPHPNGFVRSALTAPCPITVLDLSGPGIDAVTAAHPAYAPTEMDIGDYVGQQKVIHSFGLRAVLVTTAKLDSETVNRLMSAIDKHGDELRKAHPAFAGLDRNEIFSSPGLTVERHAAASKYLAEHKIGDGSTGE